MNIQTKINSHQFRNKAVWVDIIQCYGDVPFVSDGFIASFIDFIPDEVNGLVHLNVKFVSCEDNVPSHTWSMKVDVPEIDLDLNLMLNLMVSSGLDSGLSRVPTNVFLCGHEIFNSICTFNDFSEFVKSLEWIDGCFTSVSKPVKCIIPLGSSDVSFKVHFRDVKLLAPNGHGSLEHLAKSVGYLKNDRDAEISKIDVCSVYIEKLLAECVAHIGRCKLPPTLASLSVDLIEKHWKDVGINKLEVLGKEAVKTKGYCEKAGRFRQKKIEPLIDIVDAHSKLAVEAYHGGRAESFWFGPSPLDDWSDYDLKSAYSTVMAMIPKLDWANIRTSLDAADFTPSTVGVALVDFEFPAGTRFPCLPVESIEDSVLIYPLKGRSYCGAPEIAVALSLGAWIKIEHGVVVPVLDSDLRIFEGYHQFCIEQRSQHPTGTHGNLFWKEMGNSLYGKTAQGLSGRRVTKAVDGTTKAISPSPVAQPFIAAFTTSFGRALMAEIMNALPDTVEVFSVLTDGFVTNASPADIERATKGKLAALYAESRDRLTGDPTVLERKHRARQLVGIQSTGQATLVPADGNDGIILAKGNVQTPKEFRSKAEDNEFIVDLFLNREPGEKIEQTRPVNITKILKEGEKSGHETFTKSLGLEYDWKRCPCVGGYSDAYGHIWFKTKPWETTAQFHAVRSCWDSYNKDERTCLKEPKDFNAFATYLSVKTGTDTTATFRMRGDHPDLNLLRRSIGAAWKHGEAGLAAYAGLIKRPELAEMLASCGIPCTVTDLENAARGHFQPHVVPETPDVRLALSRVKQHFPLLDETLLLSQSNHGINLCGVIALS